MAKKKKRRGLKIVLGIIALLIIAGIVQKRTKDDRLKVSTEKVVQRDIVETVSASGKIHSSLAVDVIPDVNGEVLELYVQEGDSVIKGALLAKINPDNQQTAVQQASASVNSASANLAASRARTAQLQAQMQSARKNYERNLQLYNNGIISTVELENASNTMRTAESEYKALQANIRALEAQVQSSNAILNEASNNLSKTRIIAPASGVISDLNIEVGSRVSGIMGLNASTLMTIADLNKMQVEIDVSENDVVRITTGDSASIQVGAYPDKVFKGKVTQKAFSASGTNGILGTDQSTNFKVVIQILPESFKAVLKENPGKQFPFFPGMSADIDVYTKKATKVATVPIMSVTARTDEENGELEQMVFLLENGKAVARKIQTGIQDLDFIEVINGLDGNELVIAQPYDAISNTLKSGTEVKVVNKDELFD